MSTRPLHVHGEPPRILLNTVQVDDEWAPSRLWLLPPRLRIEPRRRSQPYSGAPATGFYNLTHRRDTN